MDPLQFVISILLFLILFFGIGFILNMLLKTTWLPGLILYPLVVLLIVSDVPLKGYITNPGESLARLGEKLMGLLMVDYIILGAGFIGALLSGLSIQMLRARGYRMF
ncbi:hypothetical protein CathTA2_0277 [Caldalkalibacillus thermarum TA2.A1]|uniref:YuiB family protein n=1 Tax=Caldalkalibacillus thermarum (strain TA2.A1) TaxID=986075 RepID=F5L3B6_CALTT|nr:YuiB family protein [Caldalkalibacillus thermarum]EGL84163.1 hypothetical protein CathTA2_0277 [Caldalkalibacillus thermarum TA2.A1]QZT33634.1 YuiB family protein [Caldalkalibacillus thermarum TA2.A1]